MDLIWGQFEAAQKADKKEVLAPHRKFPGEVKPIGRLDHELETFRKSIEKMTLPGLNILLKIENYSKIRKIF